MATYPGTIQVFSALSGTAKLSSPDHTGEHTLERDNIVAIETVMGTTTGTSVLKNISVGEFAVKSVGGTLTTPTIAGGTVTDPVIGTPAITGGTVASAVITSADIDTPNSMARQAIINGNFDIWQRGTSATLSSDGVFLADRWSMRRYGGAGTPPTTIIASRQTSTPGDVLNSFYYLRYYADGAGTNGSDSIYSTQQTIEHGTRYLCGLNKKVTVSFYARSDVAGRKLALGMRQIYGTGGTPTADELIQGGVIDLTTSWVRYTHTFTTNTLVGKTFGTNNDDYIYLQFAYSCGSGWDPYFGSGAGFNFVGSGYTDIAKVQLCEGDVALPFQPKSHEEELRACFRYFFAPDNSSSTAGDGSSIGYGAVTNTTTTAVALGNFPVEMRVRPSLVGGTTMSDYEVAFLYDASAQNPATITLDGLTGKQNYFLVFTYVTGKTAGAAVFLRFATNSVARGVIGFNAEL